MRLSVAADAERDVEIVAGRRAARELLLDGGAILGIDQFGEPNRVSGRKRIEAKQRASGLRPHGRARRRIDDDRAEARPAGDP